MPNIVHSMKEWTYTFDPVSKEQWIRQIESDLRQKTIASMQSTWWPGEPLMPLLHRDDVTKENITLPTSLFNQPPIIAECISTSGLSATSVNQKILNALRQDARSVILHPAVDANGYDEAWFTGVFRDLITLSYQVEDFNHSTVRLQQKIGPNDLIRITRDGSDLTLGHLLSQFDQDLSKLNSIRFIYRIESAGTWDVETAVVLNRLLEDLTDWTKFGFHPEAFLRQCLLVLEADKTYFKHIIQSRVLHLLWQNIHNHILESSGVIADQYLECHIYVSAEESPDHYLIRAAMSGLAASLAGAHAVCIHHASSEDTAELYRRANRNIHHLLHLESSMYKGADPLAGAYSIDYYTRSWTQKIWDALRL